MTEIVIFFLVLIIANFINITKPFNILIRISDCIYVFFIYWAFISKIDLWITISVILVSKLIYSIYKFYFLRFWSNWPYNFIFEFISLFLISFFVYYFSFSDILQSLLGRDFMFIQVLIYFVILYFLYLVMFYFLNLVSNFRVFFNEYYSFFYDDLRGLILGWIFNTALFLIFYDLSVKNIYLVYLLVIGLFPIALTNYNYNWIIKATMATVEKIADIIEAKNVYAKGHSKRVAELCVKFAHTLGMDYEDIERLSHSAKIMNIGYISIPEYIFGKAVNLSSNEMRYIKEHPLNAYNILKKLDIYRDIADIVKSHHESWDGSGYPDGLRGNSIPLLARIIKICDVFLALLEERAYRKAYTVEEAIKILIQEKSKFDPDIFDKFMDFLDKEYFKHVENEKVEKV
ncbi:MAG: HD domain-containing phosphohydrolase [Candidatus Calescibacterium sp.]|nr:HD domain-containing protein [Candidatus Calescibacterium sp.]MDW8133208.1 HD domain-containing phosphohydrolase [Candidatus Calescibacterium sp.]